ncbi:hypothetical protein Tco_1046751, partial [Tanacetum coccineum]
MTDEPYVIDLCLKLLETNNKVDGRNKALLDDYLADYEGICGHKHVVEIDSVFGCIKSFPRGTSCERDGLRAQYILDALCGEVSATTIDLLKAITSVITGFGLLQWALYRDRLVSKVAMKGVGKELSKYLSDFQFGVEVSGGTEAVLHSANRLLSEYHNDGSLAMLTMDFSNAFNLVQQGDPLGPLLFVLVLHPLVHKMRDSCKLFLHAWYLNDETVIGDSEEVARVLNIIKVSGTGLGLEPNIKKTETFWPSCNGVKLCEGLFPIDIRRPSLGVKLLGGV